MLSSRFCFVLTIAIVLTIVVALFSTSFYKKDIAQRLIDRFNDNSMECIDRFNRPAYQCTGIIIRAVTGIPNEQFEHAWSMGEDNTKRQSFSTAFLRKDTPFIFPSSFDTGFIIYPHAETPSLKNAYEVRCAFPVDGFTNDRVGNGCGQIVFNTMSKKCNAQGINTIDKWKQHYEKIIMSSWGRDLQRQQCGFDMTSSTAARDFSIFLKANSYLQNTSKYSFIHNELVFKVWNEDKPKDIPIEAFWYSLNSKSALARAKWYQDDYFEMSGGEIIPIVGIRFPSKSNSNINVENFERKPDNHRGSLPVQTTTYRPPTNEPTTTESHPTDGPLSLQSNQNTLQIYLVLGVFGILFAISLFYFTNKIAVYCHSSNNNGDCNNLKDVNNYV